ncbi:Probable 2-oxoglutarate-dependent dioxygenase AOP1.2, partial [Linum perenne]
DDSSTDKLLPVIDFSISDLEPETPEWDSVRSQVLKAAKGYGCFQAVVRKFPDQLQPAMNELLVKVFDLPLKAKQRNASEKPFHGYFASSSVNPRFESLGVDHPERFDKVESLTNALWPEGNIKFSNTLQSFYTEVSRLDQLVRRMIVESLGVDKYMEEHMKSSSYTLRMMRYEAPGTTDRTIRMKPHTDKNIVSIYHQGQVDGLELQTKSGNWLAANFQPDCSFLVILGESFHAWTNGRLYSPFHRVVMTGNNARYSAGLFSVPRDGYIIKAPEEMVDDEEHPLLFKPFEYSEYLKLRFADVGKAVVPSLKDYFGLFPIE